MSSPPYDIVVPSIGRDSLQVLLASLQHAKATPASLVVALDDRREGPATARNRGASMGSAPWLVFLDDDVIVTPDWAEQLHRDLSSAGPRVGAVQGRIVVPRASDRRPTDWERNTIALESAQWITADMAVRRAAFQDIGGFDQRYRRAYREDSDLAVRLECAGWQLETGARTTEHPVRSTGFLASVSAQRGNADDQLLIAVHGRDVLARIGAPASSLRTYATTTTLLALGLISLIEGGRLTRKAGRRAVAGASLAGWSWRTARFAWRRIQPGPRDRREVIRMVVTSALIPPTALLHALRGRLRYRHVAARW